MPIGGFGRHRKQLLLSFGELINHARTKGWEWTTGKKKSNCQCPALELSGAEWLAQLVGEMIFRQEFPQAQGLDKIQSLGPPTNAPSNPAGIHRVRDVQP